jgi:hypothetical protein
MSNVLVHEEELMGRMKKASIFACVIVLMVLIFVVLQS